VGPFVFAPGFHRKGREGRKGNPKKFSSEHAIPRIALAREIHSIPHPVGFIPELVSKIRNVTT
jgi:hypothetical protein